MIRQILQWMDNLSVPALRRAIVLCLFIFIWGLLTHEKYWGDGDEPHYMMIAHSLVFDRDLDVSNNYADKLNLVYDGNLEDRHVQSGRGGKLYPAHDIGLPLLASPWFWVSYTVSQTLSEKLPRGLLAKMRLNRWGLLKLFLAFGMIGVTGFLSIQVFDISLYITGNKTGCFLGTLLFIISPPILSHAYLFYTEILTAGIAVYVYKKFKIEPFLSYVPACFLGFLTGYLLLIHIRNVWISAALCGFAIWRWLDKPKEFKWLIAFFGGFLIAVAVRTGLNFYLWESLVSTPHALFQHYEKLLTLKQVVLRFFALTFDQEGGLLIYAPIYLFALAGMGTLWKHSRRVLMEIAIMFIGNYAMIVSFPIWNGHGWHGFWSPASRYLVPAIPFLVIASNIFFSKLKNLSVPAKFLIGMQCFLNLFFWQFPKLLWNDGDGRSSFLLFLNPSGALSNIFPSWNAFNFHALGISCVFFFIAWLWIASLSQDVFPTLVAGKKT